MLKRISVPFRSMIVFICVFSMLTVVMLPLMNDSSASAAEKNIIDGTASAVQAAIDDLHGAPGTIYLKSGEFYLGGIVTLHKGVEIIGAGPDDTVIRTTAANQGFIIPSGADNCRISGIKMVHVPWVAGNAIVVGGSSTSSVSNFVIDNMEFYHYGATQASIYISGNCNGLICDNYIWGSMLTPEGGYGYGIVVYGTNDTYYTDGRFMGSSDNVFIERCVIQNCKHAVAANNCAHYVFRYNEVSQSTVGNAIDAHGGGTSSQKGTVSCEIYNNTITDPISSAGYAIGMRGGQSYIYNNYASGFKIGIVYKLEYGDLSKALTYIVHDSYEWNNTYDPLYIQQKTVVSSLSDSASYIFPGTHYFPETQPDGYTPYTYPHPLSPEGGAPTNNSPITRDDSYSTDQDTELTIGNPGVLSNDSDPEGDVLSAVLASGPSHGSLTLNADGSFNYTPASGFSGTDSFSYKANDETNSSKTATVTITINTTIIAKDNPPPIAGDDSYIMEQDSELIIGNPGVLSNDSDPEGDALSAVLASGPSYGSLTLNADGSFNYTPASGFNGTDSFSYKASDGINSSNTATVTITVTTNGRALMNISDLFVYFFVQMLRNVEMTQGFDTIQ